MPHDPYKSLYVHIPFCVSRCDYCDFHTSAHKRDHLAFEGYTEHLISKIRALSKEGELSEIETVYIGGGTPTHIGNANLSSIVYAIMLHVNDRAIREFTVEANPESLIESMCKDLKALGVNRLSIGVQSFDDQELDVLGRAHGADDALDSIRMAKDHFDNVSIDLILGIPGQTVESFLGNVKKAIDLGVSHISIYPLTIEPNTRFDKLMRKGRLQLPSEDEVVDMMLRSTELLKDAGFNHYEVSNYAKPGFESKHNSSYWESKPYLGIGDSAVTMTQNPIRRMRTQDDAVTDDLDLVQMAAEDLMLAMRMSKGISDQDVERYSNVLPMLREAILRLQDEGLVALEDGRIRPTTKGWLLGNELYMEMLALAD